MTLNTNKANTVMIREDFNVPLDKAGRITDDTRLRRALPTIQQALARGRGVILLSHLGRPKAECFEPAFSLAPVADALSQLLGQPVTLIPHWQDGVSVKPGEVVLLENVRFNPGETKNDSALAKAYASLADTFVMDAFATAHRAHASTEGVMHFVPQVEMGPLFREEIDALRQATENMGRPAVAIVGGSKVSSKFGLLDRLVEKVDTLIVGGGIANTLLKAAGKAVGVSLYEPDWVDQAKALLAKAKARGVHIPLPVDVVVAPSMDAPESAHTKSIDAVDQTDAIFDIGEATAQEYAKIVNTAKTILWNGPVGVFEVPAFAKGTRLLATAVADSSAYSIAGGGDTVAALAQFKLASKISYISTGGGAFLAYLESGTLAALTALVERTKP